LHGADGTHYAPYVCTVGQVSSSHTAGWDLRTRNALCGVPRLILRLNTLFDVVATQHLVPESCLAQPTSMKIGALSHAVRKDAIR